jgi:hypothetical protein
MPCRLGALKPEVANLDEIEPALVAEPGKDRQVKQGGSLACTDHQCSRRRSHTPL